MKTEINHNLTFETFTYKDILIGKLARAVACSVISQVIILFLHIIIANVTVFHPSEWLFSVLSTFTSVSTWFFVIIFSMIIFAQCLVCAKDYVFMNSYSPTRIQQFLHVFSVHNFLLLLLHFIIGIGFIWQILFIIDSNHKYLRIDCKKDKYCFVEDTLFLILGGFWIGVYFFLKVYLSTKQLMFPVIQQSKFLQLRHNLNLIFKESLTISFWPTIYYAIFYYIWGNQIQNQCIYFLNLETAPRESSILVYLYLWWFTALYCFTMNLMRFFFSLFLTETVQFPLIKSNVNILTLQEAVVINNLPIVQNLACLDLFFLSQWHVVRRQAFFTLSQPGGHPHNWNSLIENIIKLFNDYSDLLKKSTDTSLQEIIKKVDTIQSPALVQSSTDQSWKYRNLRNMSLHSDFVDIVNVSHTNTTVAQNMKKNVDDVIKRSVEFMKIFLGINFLFGELPQINIQKCLANGQLIIWASQGISELVIASMSEDKYGIVQKDIPLIITTLVQLKQNLDKLNKAPSLSKKGVTDFNYKMKNAVNLAVKRSLFNLCFHFGKHFKDFPLGKDVLQYLQANVMLRN